MKYIRIIYFHIYNSYYKDGNYSNDIPHLTAMGIVGMGLMFCLMAVVTILSEILNSPLPSQEFLIAGSITVFVASYFIFLFRKKYETIYNEIKGSRFDKKSIKIISWFVIFVQFGLMAAVAFLVNG